MKHFLNYLIVSLVAIITLCSCTDKSARSIITVHVNNLNKKLPDNTGEYVLNKVSVIDDYVIYELSVDESSQTISEQFDSEEIHRTFGMYNIACNSTSELGEFIKLLNEANMGLKYVYTGKSTGQKFNISFTPQDIKENDWSDIKGHAKNYIYASVAYADKQLPEETDEETIWTKVDFDGEVLSYYYDLKEISFTVTELLDNRDAFVDELISSSEPDVQFESALKAAGIKIHHIYIGLKSHKSIGYTVEPLSQKRLD